MLMIGPPHLETRPKALTKECQLGVFAVGKCSSFRFSFLLAHQAPKRASRSDSEANAQKTSQLRCCGCQPCVCVMFEKCRPLPSSWNVWQAVYVRVCRLVGSVCFLFVVQCWGPFLDITHTTRCQGERLRIFKSAMLSGVCSVNENWPVTFELEKRKFANEKTKNIYNINASCAGWQPNWKSMPLNVSPPILSTPP